jgi:hypothetical protein
MAACNAYALIIFMNLGQLQLGYISLLWEAAPSCLLLVKNLKS